jgi:sugar lactone lactonase YvrE
MISVEVFDDRRCWLGEGPTATGEDNNHVQWVDVLNCKVLNKNIETNKTYEYKMDEHVSFAIPRTNGGDVLGTANGPVLRDVEGNVSGLPKRETDLYISRWNDAKVSHTGDLFLGTLSYDLLPKASGLYRISKDGSEIKKLISELTLANGLDWSVDTQTFYFIDSLAHCVDAFSYDGQEITDRRTIIKFGENEIPDGMCVDGEDGLWIAFWDGSQVRRYDEKYKLSEKIDFPVSYTTSCTFAGKDLDQLVITTAHNNEMGKHPQAGMTFICKPGIKGKKTTLFGI